MVFQATGREGDREVPFGLREPCFESSVVLWPSGLRSGSRLHCSRALLAIPWIIVRLVTQRIPRSDSGVQRSSLAASGIHMVPGRRLKTSVFDVESFQWFRP